MSVAARMHHTDFIVGGETTRLFRVPESTAHTILHSLERYEIKIDDKNGRETDDEELLDADEVFAELYAETSKAATLLRGYRNRDGLTQADLAKSLGTSQSSVASMEHGRRPISIKMAKKLANIFDTKYQSFV